VMLFKQPIRFITIQTLSLLGSRKCCHSFNTFGIPTLLRSRYYTSKVTTESITKNTFRNKYILSKFYHTMPRGVKKENLPTKICVTCNRPFTWRKKWERVWDEVTTCSKSCNRKRKQENISQRKGDFILNDNNDEGSNNIMNIDEIGSIIDDNESINSMNENFIQEEIKNLAIIDELDVNQSNSSTNNSIDQNDEIELNEDPKAILKDQRKAEKKRKKELRRAQREGRDSSGGQKQCDMCAKRVDLLIRCTYDESLQWRMVCGKCWKVASGGVVDGDASHPHYKYGGLWKNRRRKS